MPPPGPLRTASWPHAPRVLPPLPCTSGPIASHLIPMRSESFLHATRPLLHAPQALSSRPRVYPRCRSSILPRTAKPFHPTQSGNAESGSASSKRLVRNETTRYERRRRPALSSKALPRRRSLAHTASCQNNEGAASRDADEPKGSQNEDLRSQPAQGHRLRR